MIVAIIDLQSAHSNGNIYPKKKKKKKKKKKAKGLVSFKSRQNQQQQKQHEGSKVNNSGASLEWIFYFLFFGGFVGYPRSPLMCENSPRF